MPTVLALAGGVGGAKLVDGLAQCLPPDTLLAAVNTGDDFEHLGLHVSPDLDTVMYTLAGRANPATGWGLAGESWRFMQAFAEVGGETWFQLGDQDLATHVRRTTQLAAGATLSDVTTGLCRALGVAHRVVPMSNDPVRTIVETDDGELAFQDYFVRRRCEPIVRGLRFAGADRARPHPAVLDALRSPDLRAVVVCPSNPYLSIDPMLAMPALRQALQATSAPVIAVSPIVGGEAIKGPAAKIMCERGVAPSVLEVARHYGALIDVLVLDHADADKAATVAGTGVRTAVTGTVMRSHEDRRRLAGEVLAIADDLRPPAGSECR